MPREQRVSFALLGTRHRLQEGLTVKFAPLVATACLDRTLVSLAQLERLDPMQEQRTLILARLARRGSGRAEIPPLAAIVMRGNLVTRYLPPLRRRAFPVEP